MGKSDGGIFETLASQRLEERAAEEGVQAEGDERGQPVCASQTRRLSLSSINSTTEVTAGPCRLGNRATRRTRNVGDCWQDAS